MQDVQQTYSAATKVGVRLGKSASTILDGGT